MKRLAIIVAVFLLISPLASADQTLLLAYSNCYNIVGGGATITARWGPNANNCQWPNNGQLAANTQSPPYVCTSQRCMNNCTFPPGCVNCNQRICAAASITVDNACSQPTSLLFTTFVYGGGGGGGGGH